MPIKVPLVDRRLQWDGGPAFGPPCLMDGKYQCGCLGAVGRVDGS